ncbi:MAG: efflux RND transporter periplasmic adaptor subunit [Oscillospiraceae bacterium]|nr:efflux RND transporter periplasmic adaptor subunit [Oscillospiraceae bacterium]
MNRKRQLCFVLALTLLLTMTGCGGDGAAVYVQSVSELSGMGGIAPGDRFAGIVVSENVAEIQKDGEKTIAEVFVKEGDDVREGQELFSYDTEELQLTLDKQRLELEQLKATIENYKSQITELERDRNRVGAADKLQYTIQIQSTQVDLKEAELNQKSKEAEVAKSEDILANATVVSPVTGRVQSVNENGTDNYGNPLPYISIQQSGSYRVKGTLGELQRGGITEGSQLKILSRTDENQFWMGTVTLVDYENPTQENNNNYYVMSPDEMTTSSKYPFYVELENTDGLILGQHVYLEVAAEEGEASGIPVSSAFISFEEDGTAYVWAESRGKLEKRRVTLGEMNDMMGTVEILEGLTEEDYIAFPDPELCQEGADTTRTAPEAEAAAEEGGVA